MTNSNSPQSHTPSARRLHTALLSLLLAITTLFSAAQANAVDDWQLRSEEDQVRVYTREVEGSEFHAVKATTRINASSERVSQLMGDGSECAPWRAMCKSSQVLEVRSEQERYVYMVLDLPWPISDRDLVVKTTTIIDREAQNATIELQPARIDHPLKKYVRAKTQGQMKIAVIAPNEIEFTYIMHADLGGDLPAGTVNSQLVDRTLKDLRSLKKLAES